MLYSAFPAALLLVGLYDPFCCAKHVCIRLCILLYVLRLPLAISVRDVNKDLTPKDKDKDKDLTPKDQNKDKDLLGLTPQGQGQGQGPDPHGPGQGQGPDPQGPGQGQGPPKPDPQGQGQGPDPQGPGQGLEICPYKDKDEDKCHSLDTIFINVSYPYFLSSYFFLIYTYANLFKIEIHNNNALLLLVFCDICSSSLSLSFESLDSILISNFHYYFQDGRPTRYYNHRYYKPYNIYDYNRRTWQDHRHHIYRRKAI